MPHYETRTRPRPSSARIFALLLSATIILLIAGGIGFVLVGMKQHAPQPVSKRGQLLVGTWESDRGNRISLRADGTGRFKGSGTLIHYFQWRVDESNVFRTCHEVSSKANAWQSHLGAWRSGVKEPQLQCADLLSPSADGFQLRRDDGQVFHYHPTSDPLLEKAP